jgi:hypothetical protein
MPARIIEELTSRKKEKIATFLTFESIVAIILGFMPIFIVSGSWPLLTRVPLCLVGALAGYICTLEFQGLPLYEHALWTARGLFRLKTQGNRIGPEDLPGAIPAPDQDRVIVVSGLIELVQREVGRRASSTAFPAQRRDAVETDREPASERDAQPLVVN